MLRFKAKAESGDSKGDSKKAAGSKPSTASLATTAAVERKAAAKPDNASPAAQKSGQPAQQKAPEVKRPQSAAPLPKDWKPPALTQAELTQKLVGRELKGIVTRLAQFGAFVNVGWSREGWLPVFACFAGSHRVNRPSSRV